MDLLDGQKLLMKQCQSYRANYYLKKKKIIIYYFSASWVHDLELLEKLKEIYEENVKRQIGMEVIYVSSDKDEKQFNKYFKNHHGDWPGIPFANLNLAELIRYTYDITCLPQIVVVRKTDGFVITRRGKEQLEQIGINVLVVWNDYEPDLTVLDESVIELHYPQVRRATVVEEKPDEKKQEEVEEQRGDEDDDDISLQRIKNSFAIKSSTSKKMK